MTNNQNDLNKLRDDLKSNYWSDEYCAELVDKFEVAVQQQSTVEERDRVLDLLDTVQRRLSKNKGRNWLQELDDLRTEIWRGSKHWVRN